jgi:hypothetical protein
MGLSWKNDRASDDDAVQLSAAVCTAVTLLYFYFGPLRLPLMDVGVFIERALRAGGILV